MNKTCREDIVIKNAVDIANQPELIQELLELDTICYGELDKKDTGFVSSWDTNKHYTFCQVAYAGDRIIGYVDIAKFSDTGVSMLEDGLFREAHMLEYIDTSDSKEIHLYISSIVVLPEYRKQGLAQTLLEKNITDIKDVGYTIKNIYGIIWSEAGAGLLKKFKPKTIAHDPLGHPVVCVNEITEL